jgi:hypothetical protein
LGEEWRMALEVVLSEGKVLVDIVKPLPCAVTLDTAEAIDLAMKLL